MYRENKTISSSYDEKALFPSINSASLFNIVFLSYSDLSRCFINTKTKLNCLIQTTYYNPSTHRRIYMATLTPSDREDFIKYQISLEEYFQAKKKAKKKPKTKQRSKQ